MLIIIKIKNKIYIIQCDIFPYYKKKMLKKNNIKNYLYLTMSCIFLSFYKKKIIDIINILCYK